MCVYIYIACRSGDPISIGSPNLSFSWNMPPGKLWFECVHRSISLEWRNPKVDPWNLQLSPRIRHGTKAVPATTALSQDTAEAWQMEMKQPGWWSFIGQPWMGSLIFIAGHQWECLLSSVFLVAAYLEKSRTGIVRMRFFVQNHFKPIWDYVRYVSRIHVRAKLITVRWAQCPAMYGKNENEFAHPENGRCFCKLGSPSASFTTGYMSR